MARIIILGCTGSGKSTLARRLSAATGAPAIILDDIWRPGDDAGFRQIMTQLHAGEAWISDGNFAAATFDIRLPRATLIVWLGRPRWRCAMRAVTRCLRGDPHHRWRQLPKALRFIAGFERINRPRIEALRQHHAPDVPVVRLRDDDEIARFLTAAA